MPYCRHKWKGVIVPYLIFCLFLGSHNLNTIKSYKILQKLSPKHTAHGVAQSPYPIYRHGKACLSKQPPLVCSPGHSPSTRQVPDSSPGPRRVRCARFFFLLPPSGDSFIRTFPTKPTKVLGLTISFCLHCFFV